MANVRISDLTAASSVALTDELEINAGGTSKKALASLIVGAWSTFTPTVTLVGGAGNTVPVYSTNSGRYVRIGNTVYVNINCSGDGGAEGAGTGQITIALPVTVGSSVASLFTPCGRGFNNTSRWVIWAAIDASATTISIAYWASTTSLPALTGDDQNNTTRGMQLSFFYEA